MIPCLQGFLSFLVNTDSVPPRFFLCQYTQIPCLLHVGSFFNNRHKFHARKVFSWLEGTNTVPERTIIERAFSHGCREARFETHLLYCAAKCLFGGLKVHWHTPFSFFMRGCMGMGQWCTVAWKAVPPKLFWNTLPAFLQIISSDVFKWGQEEFSLTCENMTFT